MRFCRIRTRSPWLALTFYLNTAFIAACGSDPPEAEFSGCGIGPECEIPVLHACPSGVRFEVSEAQGRACVESWRGGEVPDDGFCLGTFCRGAETCESLRDVLEREILNGNWQAHSPCMVQETEIAARECLRRECGVE